MLNKPQRIQRKRVKNWRMPTDTIYIGHPGPFGNPYYIDDRCQHLSWFKADLVKERNARNGPTSEHRWAIHFWKMARLLPTLRGKNLACWCPLDQPCHGDILLEIANQ